VAEMDLKGRESSAQAAIRLVWFQIGPIIGMLLGGYGID